MATCRISPGSVTGLSERGPKGENTMKTICRLPLLLLFAALLALTMTACLTEDSHGSGSRGGDDSGSTTGRDSGARADTGSRDDGGPSNDTGSTPEDAGRDVTTTVDTSGPDEGTPHPDTTTTECPFPDGPYAFSQNGTVGPMSWPSAVAGADETMAADLAVIRCDTNVHSIFVQISATSCVYCPDRLREIADLKDHWNTYGAKWLFVVIDASDANTASTYTGNNGVTFGWRTNDADNTLSPYAISNSGVNAAEPWTGVIRTSDMVLVYDEPDDAYLDIESIARDLAGQ